MSEVRITPTLPRMESHIPLSCFFSAAVGKAQPRERSAREGLPAEATQCLGPTCVTSPELTSPSIELPLEKHKLGLSCLLPMEAGGHPENRAWLHRDATIDGAYGASRTAPAPDARLSHRHFWFNV